MSDDREFHATRAVSSNSYTTLRHLQLQGFYLAPWDLSPHRCESACWPCALSPMACSQCTSSCELWKKFTINTVFLILSSLLIFTIQVNLAKHPNSNGRMTQLRKQCQKGSKIKQIRNEINPRWRQKHSLMSHGDEGWKNKWEWTGQATSGLHRTVSAVSLFSYFPLLTWPNQTDMRQTTVYQL